MPEIVEKKRRRKRKKKGIAQSLVRAIALILFLTILVPITIYNLLPDWAYYITPGTRLWFAATEITDSYASRDFIDTLHSVEKSYDSVIEIFNEDDELIYSTYAMVDSLPYPLSKAKVLDEKYRLTYETTSGTVEAGGMGLVLKMHDTGKINIDFLVCYAYLPTGERVEICMQVSVLTSNSRIDFIVVFTLMMFILVGAMLVIAGYIRRFTRPIYNLCDITDSMANLDFSRKCPPTKIDEINQLAESVNEMSDSLDTALRDLKQKNEQLLKDIENEKTIDNLRQTFIAGISHELKTPIAIIQGYAEGAKMFYEAGNKETAVSYCDTIEEEAKRMNNMIMRLLEITRYDSGAHEIKREDFFISLLVQDWVERNAALLEEKQVNIENLIPAEIMGNGDTVILESIVNNYISNAISHLDGERIIRITAGETENGKYRISVFNTGKHIAQKDIDKIWTSFYRADKSLSRSQGRFGLGLAIVASIQRLHDEEYGVYNSDGGVVFWFDIQKA
ncbi:MAG: HAMP domain-containing histidine kinase [Clostridia bacterium]|nr:HAMP domain-containing histidine kinase [Clostridia bacterium]